MIECESVARKWGNSIGLTTTFGMLKEWKKPTKQIVKEMREDSWDE